MGAFDTTMELAGEAMPLCLGTESVVYTPATGDPVTVDALIDRRPLDGVDGLGRVPKAIVKIRNDAAAGRLAAAIDTGSDTITWSPKKGSSTTRTSAILDILDQNAACVTLMIG